MPPTKKPTKKTTPKEPCGVTIYVYENEEVSKALFVKSGSLVQVLTAVVDGKPRVTLKVTPTGALSEVSKKPPTWIHAGSHTATIQPDYTWGIRRGVGGDPRKHLFAGQTNAWSVCGEARVADRGLDTITPGKICQRCLEIGQARHLPTPPSGLVGHTKRT